MMQGQGVDAVDHVIPMPPVTGAIRAGDEKPMQNRQEDGPLHIEAKLSLCQKAADDLADPQLLPKPLADQGRSDLPRIGPDIALSGQNQKDLLGKPGKGTNQVLDLTLLLNLIHSADGGNDPLDGFGSFPAVLDDLEILVLTGCLDSRKHGDTS
jgi:hypothetical protein